MPKSILFLFLHSPVASALKQSHTIIEQLLKTPHSQLDILFSIPAAALRTTSFSEASQDSSVALDFHNLNYITSYFYKASLQASLNFQKLELRTNVLWLEGSNYNSRDYSELMEYPVYYAELKGDYTKEIDSIIQVSLEGKKQLLERLAQTPNECLFDSRFKHTAVGGTFDHLHPGHKILLSMTAYSTNSALTCGISSEPLLVNKKFKEYLESFDVRSYQVLKFLNKIKKNIHHNIVPLQDPFGPIISDSTIDSLVVSQETLLGTDKANDIRLTKSMLPMEIYPIDLIDDPEDQSRSGTTSIASKMSSTEIRRKMHFSSS